MLQPRLKHVIQMARMPSECWDQLQGVLTLEVTRPVLSWDISGRNLVLTWPASSAGFTVEVTESLKPAAWRSVPEAPVLTAEGYLLKLPMTGVNQFYRLRAP